MDPELELRRGPGFVLLALPAVLPSVISSLFIQNKVQGCGGGGPSLDPPLAKNDKHNPPLWICMELVLFLQIKMNAKRIHTNVLMTVPAITQ